MSLGERIKQIRLERGETLEGFGEHFDTPKATVWNWEDNRNKPNKVNLKKIADLGNISVNELLHGKTNEVDELFKILDKHIKLYTELGHVDTVYKLKLIRKEMLEAKS